MQVLTFSTASSYSYRQTSYQVGHFHCALFYDLSPEIQWLLTTCTDGQSEADPMLTDDDLELLTGKPVPVEVVDSVLSRHIDDLEPTLTRHGYRIKDLMAQLDAESADIKALFNNTLDPVRATELREKMLRAGLPI